MNYENNSTVASICEDIEFARENAAEFKKSSNGGLETPVLRYVAAINMGCARADFIEAAVKMGYKATTAKTCFYRGQKEMRDLDAECE